jgi:hypothetical protein
MKDANPKETSYPLAWPERWPRTPGASRRSAQFKNYGQRINTPIAMKRLEDQLDRLRARNSILSTNLPRRMDGTPRLDRGDPQDVGVAVYFTLKETRTVLACDKWNRIADNIAALAAHIEAIRAIDRYGVGTIEQAFKGYAALPAPAGHDWRELLKWDDGTIVETLDQAEYVFKQKIKTAHPDAGGSAEQASRLTAAIAAARKELGAVQ